MKYKERLTLTKAGAEIIINGGTLRSAVKELGLTKSFIHYNIHNLLKYEHPSIYKKVCKVFQKKIR